jgi:protein-tyrosine-phosphatase
MRHPFGHSRSLDPSARRHFRALFLCESNSAWSIMAEAIMNRSGRTSFRALSAGIHPSQSVDPLVLDQLHHAKLDVSTCFCKGFDGFRGPEALNLDFVFTPLPLAAEDILSRLPGYPALVRWNLEDPALISGNEATRREVIRRSFSDLQSRINLLLALPTSKLEQLVDVSRGHALAAKALS